MKPTPWSACVCLPLHVYTKLLSICFDPDPFVLLYEIASTVFFLFFMISIISGMWSPNPVTFHVAILSLLFLFLFPFSCPFPFPSQCPFPCPFPCSFRCPFPVISVRLYIIHVQIHLGMDIRQTNCPSRQKGAHGGLGGKTFKSMEKLSNG